MKAMLVGLLLLKLVGSGCESEPAVTGSDDVFVLSGAQITVATRAVVDNGLVVSGTVRNGGATRFSPYWYVEGDFYADSTFSLKLGGAVESFAFALDPGESTFLELRFTSNTFDVNQYANFRVKNLRAYREKE